MSGRGRRRDRKETSAVTALGTCIVAAALPDFSTRYVSVVLSPRPHPSLPSLSFLLLSPFFPAGKKHRISRCFVFLCSPTNGNACYAKKKNGCGGACGSLRQKKYFFFRTCFLFLSFEVYIYISGNEYFNEFSFFPYYSVCAHCGN